MPPPDVVMTLLPLNEKADAAPSEPTVDEGGAHPVGDGPEGRVVCCLAVDVDGEDCADALPGTDEVVDGFGQQDGTQVARQGVDVDEDWPCPRVEDGVDGRREREGGRRDDVSGADADGEQRQVEGRSARGDGDTVRDADTVGDLAFERVDLGSEGSDPAGAQGSQHGGLLEESHVGDGQVDAAHWRVSTGTAGGVLATTPTDVGGKTRRCLVQMM
jgi:hypothetical protein